nr:nibrin isoform X1 [Osmia lignaria]
MWYLQKQNGDRRIYLKPLVEIIIGRKRGDLLIPDDDSISKTHASICVQPKSDIRFDQPISTCIIKDEESRYGTYIIKENHKIEISEEGYELSSQDVIRFGLQNSLFTVTYIPVISVISTLNDEDKSTLQNLMDQIDGVISTEWTNNCTHLTVSKATLTEKVTWALASAIPIVTIDYWIAVQRAVTNNQELPSPDNYIPPIGESLVDKTKLLLHPNNKRKTLFSNLIFVHFSMNQYKIYGKMIHLAGGRSVLFSKKPLTPKELCSPNVIVLQYPGDDTTQSTQHIVPEYDSIYKALQEHRRKMIPEFEIPLAILHCSVEKYCNPKFRFSEFFKISETRPETRPERSKVIIIDTQDVDVGPSTSNANLPRSKQAVKIIPETNDSFSSQDLTCTSHFQKSLKGLVCSTPVKNNNKLKSNFNVIATESIKQDAKAQHSKENVCIPETCDSFASNATSMDLQSSTQNSVILRNDKKTENSQSLKSPTTASVKPRIKEVVDISQEDDIFEKIQSTTKKINARLNKVLTSKRIGNLKTNSSPVQPNPSKIIEHLSEVSVFKKSDTLSKTNESPIRKTPIENLKGNSQESTIVVCLSDEDSVGFNESNTAKSNTNEVESIDKNVRGNASDCCKGSMDDDTHRDESSISRLNKCSKKSKSPVKRTLSYDSVAEMSSTSRAEHEESISNNTNQQHQTTLNFKRFKKAPVIIPKKRIGLSNMYVWQKNIA